MVSPLLLLGSEPLVLPHIQNANSAFPWPIMKGSQQKPFFASHDGYESSAIDCYVCGIIYSKNRLIPEGKLKIMKWLSSS